MTEEITWRDYEPGPDSTVVGDVRVSDPLGVDYLDVERELLAYLPPSYEEGDEDYPVVYMHDGRNLFDEATSNDGEWGVDGTMERLADEGIEAIVVGIPNAGEQRSAEYAPFLDRREERPDGEPNPLAEYEPLGDAYADFLVDRVVPLVDEAFRTSDERAETGLVGSSMGGLISLYCFFRDPERFGFVGAMSPAVCFPWRGIFEFVEDAGYVEGDVYVDVGGDEFPDDPRGSERFYEGAHELVDLLEELGYDEKLEFVVEEDAIHHERAWRRRFPDAVRFLLG